MKTRPQAQSEESTAGSGWSIRILVLAIAGILLLTLYPFRLVFHRYIPGTASPFFLEGSGKGSGLFDGLLNVMLFVPFGFGLAGVIRKRGNSPIATAALVFAAGALFSYAIELLQFFIPERDSGWEDVVTNSLGALGGCIAFQMWGATLLRFLYNCEKAVETFATAKNVAIVLLLYFGAWFALSAYFQKETAPSNWKPDALLVVGNSVSGQLASAWKGEVYELEFWDHALPDEIARNLTAKDSPGRPDPDALVAYEFSGSPPFPDQHRFLPSLEWAPKQPPPTDPVNSLWDGSSWVATRSPISALVADVQKTRQFSVRVRCKPTRVEGVRAQIVSIAPPGGTINLEIRQDNNSLGFWFRNRMSARRSQLAWFIPDVFAANEPRDLLFSYDGSKLSLFIDGRILNRAYRLGPATGLARMIRRVKTVELQGYRYVFYALMFFPAGCLLGLTWRRWRRLAARHFSGLLSVGFAFLFPPILLEVILVRVGGQSISLGNIALAIAMALAGGLWINLGGNILKTPARSPIQTSTS